MTILCLLMGTAGTVAHRTSHAALRTPVTGTPYTAGMESVLSVAKREAGCAMKARPVRLDLFPMWMRSAAAGDSGRIAAMGAAIAMASNP